MLVEVSVLCCKRCAPLGKLQVLHSLCAVLISYNNRFRYQRLRNYRMKIIAKREAILKPLQAVIGVVERRQTMPILANVLLVGERRQALPITATDLEVELVATPRWTCSERARSRCPDASCSTSVGPCRKASRSRSAGRRTHDRAGPQSRFTLSTLPAAEFPAVEEINASRRCSWRRRTSSACSRRRTSRWPSRTCATT